MKLNSKDYPIQPVSFTAVSLTDPFWTARKETNRTVTIPFAFAKCEEHGRMDNFAIAGGLKQGEHRGKFPFDDTDVYKIIEGASFSLSVHPDPELDRYLDDIITLIAAAQEDDGYLFTPITNRSAGLYHRIGSGRWEMLKQYSHELYNCGHLYEAAVAHYQATGKRSLLDVAIRNAELIDRTFGPGKNETPPGHQIIEMGLARLYRVTGEERYLQLAKFFLETRGPGGRAYSQEHKKVLDQDEAVGHAVRAGYMYAGMADVAALTGDKRFLAAVDRLWQNVVTKKLYITGGIGSRHSGEAFGENYELPNASAYCETCAAISNVYWNHRLFLLHNDAKYIDVMERTLYNALLSGISFDGKEFFYPNALESYGQHKRSPWFGCSCCPGNVTRFISSIAGYVYAQHKDEVYVNLFIAGRVTVDVGGTKVELVQETRYPWDGAVAITVKPEMAGEFTVKIRIPGWCRNEVVPSDLYNYLGESKEKPLLSVNGSAAAVEIENGYVTIRHVWQAGDVIRLNLPMPVRRVVCNELVQENIGKVALERGPLVYCLEWPDVEDEHVVNLLLPDNALLETEFREDLFNGVQVITGTAMAFYTRPEGASMQQEKKFTAIPYYAWAHRGQGEMAIWLARTPEAVRPLPVDTLVQRSTVSFSQGHNPNHRYFCWMPERESLEWIQFDFPAVETVSSVEVYWFDDTDNRDRDYPDSWQVLYRQGKEWLPVQTAGPYEISRDTFVTVPFEPVSTTALRIEIHVPPVGGGLLDVRIQ